MVTLDVESKNIICFVSHQTGRQSQNKPFRSEKLCEFMSLSICSKAGWRKSATVIHTCICFSIDFAAEHFVSHGFLSCFVSIIMMCQTGAGIYNDFEGNQEKCSHDKRYIYI